MVNLKNKEMFEKNYFILLYFSLLVLSIINLLDLQYDYTIFLIFFLTVIFLSLKFHKNYLLILFGILIMLEIGGFNRFLISNYGIKYFSFAIQILILAVIIYRQKEIYISKKTISLIIAFNVFIFVYLIFGSLNSNTYSLMNFIRVFISNSIILYITIVILVLNSNKNIGLFLQIITLFISSLVIFDWINLSRQYNLDEYFVRGSGLFGNANIAGATILIFSLFIFYRFLSHFLLSDALIILYSFFSLILTQSRSSLIIFILLIIAMTAFFEKYSLKKSFKILIFISLVLGIFFIVTNLYPSFLIKLNVSSENFDSSRIEALNVGLSTIDDSLFGKGIGQSAETTLNLSSHNFYVHALSETGVFIIPFAILFLFIVFYSINKAGKTNNIPNYYLLLLLLISIFTHSILANSIYYFLLGIIFVYARKDMKFND
ncbi:O-antigen ligase [Planomicrobium koreense]|uniref:O-antigen ligase n=1 Tax=Planococcus koreensis TaxID=112331 RepID=A0A7W8CQ29_9BACL|nr:O-antigen ligase family protein [Planococcus koreensis]MBB5179386.1 O-antigen ligase [Planococcus koreensis]